MNFQEAYTILDQVSSAYKGTRSEHTALSEALRLFAELINKEVNRDISNTQANNTNNTNNTNNANNVPDTSVIK